MKTLSVLFFALIFALGFLPGLNQNLVFAQIEVPPVSSPACMYCLARIQNGEAHKLYKGSKCPQDNNTESKESNSSNSLSFENEIKLTLIQAAINFIFGNNEIDNKEKERQLKEKQKELERIAIEGEKQRLLKEQIAQELHNNLMALYKQLPGSENLEEKKLSDFFEDKSFDGNNQDLGFKEIDISKNEELPKTGEEVYTGFFGKEVISQEDFENIAKTDALVKQEQIKYDNNFDEWVKDNNGDVLLRLKDSDPYLVAVTNSIKTKAPPLLEPYSEPVKNVNDLKPGDVLLVGNKWYDPANLITFTDMLFSKTLNTKASHTLVYLKEIGGQKMFLDAQPGQGEKIITEFEFFKIYGHRPMEVAQCIVQPVRSDIGDKLYSEAFELVGENEQYKYNNPYGIFTGTKFGLLEDMVCSEADAWVLRKAGFVFPGTEGKIKKILGLDFSPADYKKSGWFFITPLKLNEEDY